MADEKLTGEEVGGVLVTFDGNTKPLDTATDHVQGKLKSLVPAFDQLASAARKAFLGIAAAAGFAVKAFADTEAAESKLSSALRVSAEQSQSAKASFQQYANVLAAIQPRNLTNNIRTNTVSSGIVKNTVESNLTRNVRNNSLDNDVVRKSVENNLQTNSNINASGKLPILPQGKTIDIPVRIEKPTLPPLPTVKPIDVAVKVAKPTPPILPNIKPIEIGTMVKPIVAPKLDTKQLNQTFQPLVQPKVIQADLSALDKSHQPIVDPKVSKADLSALDATHSPTVAPKVDTKPLQPLDKAHSPTVTPKVDTKPLAGLAAAVKPIAIPITLKMDNLDAQLKTVQNDLIAFNEAMQLLTVNDKNAYTSVEAFALNLGVAAEDLEQVTKVGAGLAERFFGGDLQAGAEAAAKAYNGNFRELQRLLPQLKLLSSAGEKWAYIQQQGNAGFEQAKARTNTFNGSLKQLWNQVNQTAEGFGELLVPALKEVNHFFAELAVALQQLTPEQKQQVVEWGAIAAGVTALIGFGPKLITAFALPLKLIGGAFSLLMTPIGLTIAAIAAVGASAAYMAGKGDTATSRMIDGFKRIGNGAIQLFSSWHNFTSGISAAWGTATAVISNSWEAVKNYLGQSWEDLKGAASEVVDYWVGVFKAFGNFVTDLFDQATTSINDSFSGLADGSVKVFKAIGGAVADVAVFIGDMFGSAFGVVSDGFKRFATIFATVADSMFGSWQGFIEGMITLWHQSGFILLDVWTKTKAGLLNLWAEMKAAFADVFYYWGGIIAQFGSNMFSTMKTIAENVRNIWNEVIDAIANRLAKLAVTHEASKDIDSVVSEGQTVDTKKANEIATVVASNDKARPGETGEQTAARRTSERNQIVNSLTTGKPLTADDINGLKATLTDIRAKSLVDIQDKGRQAAEQTHQDNLANIQSDNDKNISGIQKWSDKGLDNTNATLDSDKAANNASRDKDLKASQTAANTDLQADLAKLKTMPKLSDKAKALWDTVGDLFDKNPFTALKNKAKAAKDGLDKSMDDATKEAQKKTDTKNVRGGATLQASDFGQGGKSLDDIFKARLGYVTAAAAINKQHGSNIDNKSNLKLIESSDKNTTAILTSAKVHSEVAAAAKALTMALKGGIAAIAIP